MLKILLKFNLLRFAIMQSIPNSNWTFFITSVFSLTIKLGFRFLMKVVYSVSISSGWISGYEERNFEVFTGLKNCWEGPGLDSMSPHKHNKNGSLTTLMPPDWSFISETKGRRLKYLESTKLCTVLPAAAIHKVMLFSILAPAPPNALLILDSCFTLLNKSGTQATWLQEMGGLYFNQEL